MPKLIIQSWTPLRVNVRALLRKHGAREGCGQLPGAVSATARASAWGELT